MGLWGAKLGRPHCSACIPAAKPWTIPQNQKLESQGANYGPPHCRARIAVSISWNIPEHTKPSNARDLRLLTARHAMMCYCTAYGKICILQHITTFYSIQHDSQHITTRYSNDTKYPSIDCNTSRRFTTYHNMDIPAHCVIVLHITK